MSAPGSAPMRRTIVGLLLAMTGLVGCLHTPMSWSPDGSWIAYTVEVRPCDPFLISNWIFETGPVRSSNSGGQVLGYRLWATQATTGKSVLLEDSVGPITAPGWSADGRALAFGRVVIAPDRSSRFEVVVLDGLTKRRVVSSRPLTALDAEVSRLPYQAIAWSPDGRFLAVPNLDPMGLAIVRADNGRTVNVLPDAFLPAWSPSGGRLAFYVRSGGHALHYIESALGQPRHLVDVGQAQQAPAWTHDGSSILLVARRASGQRGADGPETQELLRVQLRGDQFDLIPLRPLAAEFGLSREHPVEGVSITFDQDVENLFASTVVEGQPHQIVWYHPRDNAIFKRFAMIDPLIPVGSLAFSPDGRTLAARLGSNEPLSAPVFCDTETNDLRCLLVAPDDSTRLEWIASLVRAARTILGGLPPATTKAATQQTRAVKRPSILPVRSELVARSEDSSRLRRIGRLGRPLCDRPLGSPELDPRTRQIFDEAQFFFDYLREDYGAALVKLASLEAAAETPERRLAWLSIRAQILINQGQFSSARRIVTYLEHQDDPRTRQLEWTGISYQLSEEFRPDRGWPRFLDQSASQMQLAADESLRSEPTPEVRLERDLPLFRPADEFRPARVFVGPQGNDPAPSRRPILRRGPAPQKDAVPRR